MAKQEEIRDVKGGIGDVLRQMNTEVMLESGRDYGYYIDKILRYLHSQDVVIAKYGVYSDLMESLINEDKNY